MNNRAQISAYSVQWIIFTSLMLIIIFGSMLFLLDGLLYPNRNPFPAEASILANNILFSSDGFAAVDNSGRTLPGVLDMGKTKKNLDTLIEGKRLTGVKITIGAQEYYYGKSNYDVLKTRIGFSGRGGAQQFIQKYVLLMRTETSTYPTPVTIEVLGGGVS